MKYKLVKLNSICNTVSGKTAPKDNEFTTEGLPFIRAGHLGSLCSGSLESSLPKISEEQAKNKKYNTIPKDTVLFAKSGMSIMKNRIYLTQNETYIVNHLAGVLPNKEIMEPRFLKYYLNIYKPSYLVQDSSYPSIRLADVRNLEIPLPPKPIQIKIANALDKAQELIDNRKAQIEKYEELLQSVFLDMFGDPVSNPKGWEVKKLGNIFNISSGSTPSRKNKEFYKNGNIPWIKTGEVKFKTITMSEESITKEALENSSCRLYPKNTILVAMYGQGITRGRVGILGIEATTNQACCAIIPSDTDRVSMKYIYEYLKLSYDVLRKLGRGGNQPNLNIGMIKDFEIILPTLLLQNQFASIVEKVQGEKKKMEDSLVELENNFNSIMQRAFRGELF